MNFGQTLHHRRKETSTSTPSQLDHSIEYARILSFKTKLKQDEKDVEGV